MKVNKVLLSGVLVGILFILATGICWAERMAVKVPKANVRHGPGTQYDILWEVEKYYPVKVLETAGEWCRFRDFENDKGWIYKPLLDQTPTVITFKKKCNVRSGPGTQYKIAFTAVKGIPFKVLKRKDNWIQVIHADGDQGWIYKSLVW